jgi:hypothetical protein
MGWFGGIGLHARADGGLLLRGASSDGDARTAMWLSEYRCCLVGLRHFWDGERI